MNKIHKTAVLFLAMAFSLSAEAQQPDYWRSDSIKVVRLLNQAAKLDTNTNFMIYFARQLRGLPYVGKTLEKNNDERLIVNLRQLDCTTYVETVLALARCARQKQTSFENYCQQLQQIRYRDGNVAYTNRLHYFTTWMEDNSAKGIVEKIEQPQQLFSAIQTVNTNYMTTHINLYPMLVKNNNWVPLIRNMEKEITGRRFSYIPKSRLKDSKLLRQTVKDGDIIAILTSKKGLDTSHIGIAVWHKDGLHLLNASSLRHKVVEEPKTFYQYMMEQKSHIGIRVVRMK